jgi:hypothetical protein
VEELAGDGTQEVEALEVALANQENPGCGVGPGFIRGILGLLFPIQPIADSPRNLQSLGLALSGLIQPTSSSIDLTELREVLVSHTDMNPEWLDPVAMNILKGWDQNNLTAFVSSCAEDCQAGIRPRIFNTNENVDSGGFATRYATTVTEPQGRVYRNYSTRSAFPSDVPPLT